MLIETLSHWKSLNCVSEIVPVSAFLGEKFFKSLLNRLDRDLLGRIDKKKIVFPSQGPRSFFEVGHLFPKKEVLGNSLNKKELERELDEIAEKAETSYRFRKEPNSSGKGFRDISEPKHLLKKI